MSDHRSAEKEQVRRPEPLRDEWRDGEAVWTIEAHDDQPIAEGQKYAADLRVLVLLDGERVREFTYPAYRIWTLLAHWTEGIEVLAAELGLPAGNTTPAEGGEPS
ncbi:hypothetical protein ABKW28_12920 [Nocardioides sp. 31GB23]|uniref:hypothetical protein n=1 Tax=Nocardioides sp. 31GB23 TaxID=3156065 RepID=UPI0032B00F64